MILFEINLLPHTEYRPPVQEVDVHPGPELSPGHHLVPFAVPLPPNLPSSVEEEFGKVTYQLQASIVRDWKFDHEVQEPLRVSGIFDLNLLPAAKQKGI